jgi:hypothetical protein
MSSEYNIANAYPLVFDGQERVGPNIKGVVYLWTENDIPCYIGLTTQYIRQRIRGHIRAKRNLLFHNKLTNNIETFRCYILYNSNKLDQLENAEKYYIKKYNTFVKTNPDHGYNLTEGGNIFSHTDDTKIKISNSKKGRKVIFTEDHKHNLSKANKGKKFSQDHIKKLTKVRNTESFRQKIIESNKKRKYSIETIEKMRQSAKNRWKKNITQI